MVNTIKAQLASNILVYAPKIMSKPLKYVPFSVKNQLLIQMLQLTLSSQQQDGELAFLFGRTVAIHIVDLALDFQISFTDKWQVTEIIADKPADVRFGGQSADFLLVIAGKEDPDTLFFQRKLCIEGDTELGLEVKSLLTSIEFDTLPMVIRVAVEKLAQVLMSLQCAAVGEN